MVLLVVGLSPMSCSRETVSATLGQFRDLGLIRVDGRTMTIVNQEGLRKLLG